MPVGVVYRSNTPNGYSFVRSLGEVGVPLLALSDGGALGRLHSRYALSMGCPNALQDSEAFVQFLTEIGKKLPNRPTLFIMNDPHLIVVAHNRHLLDPYYEIPMPTWQVLEQCLDKAIMHRAALAAGIPTPATYFPTSDEDLTNIETHVPYPCIVKPVSRFEFRDGALKQKSFQQAYGGKALRANNADELHRLWHQTQSDDFQVIVQEEIPGAEDTLYSVGLYADRESQVRAVFASRKLHQLPPDFGHGTYVESVNIGAGSPCPSPRPVEPNIVDLARDLVTQVRYHGIAHIEFKLDARDGLYKLMEINPRGWQFSYLATACGVNLPYLAHWDLQHDAEARLRRPESCQTTARKTWTYIGDDIQRQWRYGQHGDHCEKTSWRTWLKWATATLLRKDNYDGVLNRRDPLAGLFMFTRSILSAFRRRNSSSPPQ
jgi:predicted ATP-grasp superfamily ATP-dependent carboligase